MKKKDFLLIAMIILLFVAISLNSVNAFFLNGMNITIDSPENATYSTSIVTLNWSANSTTDLDIIKYSLNGASNVSLENSSDISYYDTWDIGTVIPVSIYNNDTYFWIIDNNGINISRYYINRTFVDTVSLTGYGYDYAAGLTFNGSHFFVTDIQGDVQYYDSSWNHIGKFIETNTVGNDNPFGITQNGTFFWIVDYTSDNVYKYLINGSYVENFTLNSSNSNPYGIDMDDNYLYVTDSNGYIYKYNHDGTYANSTIALNDGNSLPYGISLYDKFFYVIDFTDRLVYRYKPSFINTTLTCGAISNNVTIYANDTSGNINSSMIYFSYDPIDIISPENTTYNNRTIILSFNQGTYEPQYCNYSLNGATNISAYDAFPIDSFFGNNAFFMDGNSSHLWFTQVSGQNITLIDHEGNNVSSFTFNMCEPTGIDYNTTYLQIACNDTVYYWYPNGTDSGNYVNFSSAIDGYIYGFDDNGTNYFITNGSNIVKITNGNLTYLNNFTVTDEYTGNVSLNGISYNNGTLYITSSFVTYPEEDILQRLYVYYINGTKTGQYNISEYSTSIDLAVKYGIYVDNNIYITDYLNDNIREYEFGCQNGTIWANLGQNNITLLYSDVNGIAITETQYFATEDIQNPSINSNSTIPSTIGYLDNLTINANVTDDFEVSSVLFTLTRSNGSVVINSVNGTNYNTNSWNSSNYIIDAIGNWTINITAVDTSNNTNESIFNFTVSYGNLSVSPPESESLWDFTQNPGNTTSGTFSFSHTGTSNKTMNISYSGNLSNTSLFTVNVSENPFNVTYNHTKNITINITLNSSISNGTYTGQISWNRTNDQGYEESDSINVTVYVTESEFGIANFLNYSFAIAGTAGSNYARTFTINNTGTANLSSCNMSYIANPGLSISFSDNNFNMIPYNTHSVTGTFFTSNTYSDEYMEVYVECISSLTGSIDSDYVIGSLVFITSSNLGGGGGGGTVTKNVSFDIDPVQIVVFGKRGEKSIIHPLNREGTFMVRNLGSDKIKINVKKSGEYSDLVEILNDTIELENGSIGTSYLRYNINDNIDNGIYQVIVNFEEETTKQFKTGIITIYISEFSLVYDSLSSVLDSLFYPIILDGKAINFSVDRDGIVIPSGNGAIYEIPVGFIFIALSFIITNLLMKRLFKESKKNMIVRILVPLVVAIIVMVMLV